VDEFLGGYGSLIVPLVIILLVYLVVRARER